METVDPPNKKPSPPWTSSQVLEDASKRSSKASEEDAYSVALRQRVICDGKRRSNSPNSVDPPSISPHHAWDNLPVVQHTVNRTANPPSTLQSVPSNESVLTDESYDTACIEHSAACPVPNGFLELDRSPDGTVVLATVNKLPKALKNTVPVYSADGLLLVGLINHRLRPVIVERTKATSQARPHLNDTWDLFCVVSQTTDYSQTIRSMDRLDR